MGVHEGMDVRQAKRIVLSNQISLSVAALSLPYIGIFLLMGSGLMGWLEVPIFLGYLSIHRFNKAGYTWLSRILLVILSDVDFFSYGLSLGKATGLHFIFLPACWAPLLIFAWEEKRSMIFSIGLSCLLLLGLQAFGPDQGIENTFSPAQNRGLHFVVILTVNAAQIIFLLYFFQGNRRTESALGQAGEAAQAADEAKSRFLANMSHEIRTPLHGILGMSTLLQRTNLAQDRRETVRDIQGSAQDLLVIVNEILDLSKIETGKMSIESAPFELEDLVRTVIRPFEYEARKKRLTFSLQLAEGLPTVIIGDSARLKQVLRNLLGNAFKFTDTEGIVLRVGQVTSELPGGRIHFEIEDTGIGIPEDAQQKIFHSFTQADGSTTRKYGGTGLGLFICKQIVDMMGGKIGFRSLQGSGTLFHFTIPFEISEADRKSRGSGDKPSFHAVQERVTGKKVLVVDDHPLNRKVLAGLLESYGLVVDQAGGGAEALEIYAEGKHQAVFLDCHMPEMDGYACAKHLRGMTGEMTRLALIGVTADAMAENRRRCLDAGMDDVLTKPILEEELLRVLAEFIAAMPPNRPAEKTEPPPVSPKISPEKRLLL